MPSRAEARDMLRRAGELPDERLPLGDLSLAFAALDRPEVSLDRYRAHLDELARDLGALGADAADADSRAAALRSVLAEKHGYQGDRQTYDDLQNANLMRVIDRRRGLPVALGILYLHAARALGWPAFGLNFPGHFLIRVDGEGGRRILDPFAGGAERDAASLRDLLKFAAGPDAELTPDRYAPVGNRTILLRLQMNLKTRCLRAGEPARALGIVQDALLLAPAEAGLWREAGLLHAHLEEIPAAIAALERFVELAPNGTVRHQTAMLIQQLRGRLN